MGEALPNGEQQFQGPQLVVIEGYGEEPTAPQGQLAEVSDVPWRYPDYVFAIPAYSVVTETFTVTPDYRLRVSARAIAAQEPTFASLADSAYQKEILRTRDSFMKQIVMHKAKGVERTVRAHELADFNRAADTIYEDMVSINHPTAQLIRYLTTTYPKIDTADITRLRRDLVALTAWEQVRAELTDQATIALEGLKKLREAKPSSP